MTRTLFDKLWEQHTVEELDDGLSLLYIDPHSSCTSAPALSPCRACMKNGHTRALAGAGLAWTFCTMDHIVDTIPGRNDDTLMPSGRAFIEAHPPRNPTEAAFTLFDMDDPAQGIVHVISPEQCIVLPGLSLVCPDSHTCTPGCAGRTGLGSGLIGKLSTPW